MYPYSPGDQPGYAPPSGDWYYVPTVADQRRAQLIVHGLRDIQAEQARQERAQRFADALQQTYTAWRASLSPRARRRLDLALVTTISAAIVWLAIFEWFIKPWWNH